MRSHPPQCWDWRTNPGRCHAGRWTKTASGSLRERARGWLKRAARDSFPPASGAVVPVPHPAAGRLHVRHGGRAPRRACVRGWGADESVRHRFDDDNIAFFGVCTDDARRDDALLQDEIPGVRFFWDADCALGGLYGVADPEGAERNVTYVLSPDLRVMATFHGTGDAQLVSLLALLDRLPAHLRRRAWLPTRRPCSSCPGCSSRRCVGTSSPDMRNRAGRIPASCGTWTARPRD